MTAPQSEAERLALAPSAEREAWFKACKHPERIAHDWAYWRRPSQVPPEGDWRGWFIMAGRGFGKTRMAAEWVRDVAENDGAARIALVAATLHEARTIMVEGESGLLSIAPPDQRPTFEPSLRRLSWPNGAIATLYSAAEPDSLRGPQHSHGWADEIAKWDNAVKAWNNLDMTLRLGHAPRIVATTTPRPVPLVRRLLAEPDFVLTRGTTQDNRANLPTAFLSAMQRVYAGTRLGRQELAGELLDDVEGALWTRALIEQCRDDAVPPLARVVIGVDPPASATGDACGIIAVGLGSDGHAWVLGDHSVRGKSPEGWARAVSAAAARWQADRVIAEANQGGDMVAATLRAADIALPVKLVHASRGKVARAEPVHALYESGRVHHAGAFPDLEDELCGLMTGGGYEGPGRSPDRADALVWAVTEVMLGRKASSAKITRL
ncbi:MAG: DNA-packaging protein [Sphingomonadales bacterium]|nr:DNA-packaging protein [Sphingomonadales bacterium]